MTMNPKMKVLVQQGYFDLACPYRTVEYAIDHLDIAPELRGNVAIEYFDAGHMMYVAPGVDAEVQAGPGGVRRFEQPLSTRDAQGLCGHFPMQKLPKIRPSRSSLVTSPVISPRSRCASVQFLGDQFAGVALDEQAMRFLDVSPCPTQRVEVAAAGRERAARRPDESRRTPSGVRAGRSRPPPDDAH